MVQHQMQQHQQKPPWWAGPLQGFGGALHGMQQNMQRVAEGFAQQHTARSPTRHSSVTLANAPQPAAFHSLKRPDGSSSQQHTDVFSLSNRSRSKQSSQQQVTKEELGRATWVFLHTLAAQFPEQPSSQQQRDARQLIDSLTRIYPCADCAQHFQELVK